MYQVILDRDLLRAYALENSERAFAQLVERYMRLVFGTALRVVSNEQAAQEISQEVFIELARKAGWLSGEVALGGWLYKTAVFKGRQWWRSEERRRRREEIAGAMQKTMNDESSSLGAMQQILDEALLSLKQKEREALLLRFVEECSQREVGACCGVRVSDSHKRFFANFAVEQRRSASVWVRFSRNEFGRRRANMRAQCRTWACGGRCQAPAAGWFTETTGRNRRCSLMFRVLG